MENQEEKKEFYNVSALQVIQFILGNYRIYLMATVAVVAIATVVAFMLPVRYRSTANLLPIENKPIGLSLLGTGSSISKAAGSLLGGKSDEIEKFYVILESRTVKERMIQRFDLIKRYEFENAAFPLEAAMNKLVERSNFKDYENGNFLISVEDEDPGITQAMCQFYVEQLNQTFNEVQKQESAQFRNFIENRYNLAMHQLDSVATAFKLFQEKNSIVDIQIQAEQYFTLLAEVTSEEIRAKMKYDLLSQNMNRNSESVAKALDEWMILKRQYTEMLNKPDMENPIMLKYGKIPEIGLEFARLKMDLDIRQEILKFLTPVLEQARMEEMKNLSIVKVIDAPELPIRKSWPKKSIILLVSLLVWLVGSFFLTASGLLIINNRQYLRDRFITNKNGL